MEMETDAPLQNNNLEGIEIRKNHSVFFIVIIIILVLISAGLLTALILQIKSNKQETPVETGSLPLIELHYHLDGGITVEIARKMAEMQGIQDILPESDEELHKLLVYEYNPDIPAEEGLNEYLTKFDLPGKLMQTKVGIKQAIILQAEALKKHGVVYAEMRFAPQFHVNKGLTQKEVIEAAIEAVQETAIPVNLILCAMRGNDTAMLDGNDETIELAGKYVVKDHGVVAVDLAGAEALYPTEDFKELFQRARELNVPITIHAGEADGYKSVDAALEMGAVRIGHGVHSRDSKETLEKLKKLEIAVEITPTSEVQTHTTKDYADNPIKQFLDQGIKVTINTDNSGVSNIYLDEEMKLAEETFKLTKEEKKTLIRNAIFSAFCGGETKQKLLDLLAKY